MKRTVLIFFASILYTTTFSQLQKGQVDVKQIPKPVHKYLTEYTFDSPTTPELWAKEKKGLNTAFATTDKLFLRSEVPVVKNNNGSWNATGWRGERVHAQVLVWSPDTLEQVRVLVSDLTSRSMKSIAKSNITTNLVRYVLSNFGYSARALSCGAGSADTAYLMPDRFESFDRFDLPGRTVRPIWISVNIPEDAEPGIYQGSIQVKSDKQSETLSFTINVQNQHLPKPKDWKYRLDLWQNPWVVAWHYQVEPWSDEHKMLLKKHLKPYADAGGKYITTYAVHSPWSDNSYMIEGGMIEWIRTKDNQWKFDYTIFDEYVVLAMEAGIDKAITIYTPVPWGYRFRYIDEASGNYVNESWAPDSKEFKTFFSLFLTDLKTHLQKKGWLEKTYLGINENPLEVTIAAAKAIREHSKEWKITYAGDWHPELTDLLDDYSPVISSEPSLKELQYRKSKGFTTTFYVCCTPPQPNNFVFSPPIEGEYISWYAAAYGYDGFLRWAYDAWPADPMRDARHTLWPAGDCFLVYPGGGSSIRFEKLREGIVAYEKIRIIRELAAKSSDKKVKTLITAFEKHLYGFVGDRDFNKRVYNVSNMSDAVLQGKRMIADLTEALK